MPRWTARVAVKFPGLVRLPGLCRLAGGVAVAAVMVKLVALTGCGPVAVPGPEREDVAPRVIAEPIGLTPAMVGVQDAMDGSASPCHDFYQYACGGWLASHEIAADKSAISPVGDIDDRTHKLLRELLEAAAQRPTEDLRRNKIGDFYAACMDAAVIDGAGLVPLGPALADIDKVVDLQGAYEVAARLRGYGVEGFLFAEVEPDYKQPNIYMLTVRQGGLGLPSREFYLRADAESQALLARYTEHVAGMLTLLGASRADAARGAKAVVALETTLAQASLPLEQLREVEATYHRMSATELGRLAPQLDWGRVFTAAGNAGMRHVNVATPEFFRGALAQLVGTPGAVLRDYLRWQLLRANAEHLAASIEAQSFRWTAQLTGQQTEVPRWRRCVDRTVAALPEAVGPYYVERAFPGGSKKIALEMITTIERAFAAGLAALPWMDDATRARAQEKAAAIRNKIGYPDHWRDHSQVKIDRGNYFASMHSARTAELARQMARPGQAVDRDDWPSPPSILNAYANPLGPEMMFPAAILQPPLYSTELPMAVNFGAIGAIMGHELTHHFDDQGRKFDATGALASWWTDAAQRGFAAATRCVVEQYDAYEVAPGLHVNGQQTLGENIADLGGLKLAHAGFMRWAAEHPEPSPIAALTPEQLFFVAYAQTYCAKMRPELERVRIVSDVHAPWRFRVLGPLSNSPAFATAFACAEGTPLRPAQRCSVW